MPEAAGEAARYVDPHDVDSIADGLITLAGDTKLRDEFSRLGRIRAGLFDWDKSAEAMIDVYMMASERD